MDKDVFTDELIGQADIDLEERLMDENYRGMIEQPIERRKLFAVGNGQEMGYINLWVDMDIVQSKKDSILQKKKVPNQEWDIQSIPTQEFELRIIVWETTNVPNNDPEDMSDIFVKVAMNSLDNDLSSETDTHVRSSTGFVKINIIFSLFLTNFRGLSIGGLNSH